MSYLVTFRITINFTHFDIEGNNQDCEYDSLTISSKMGSEEARNHGLFCGNKLPPVSSIGVYSTLYSSPSTPPQLTI